MDAAFTLGDFTLSDSASAVERALQEWDEAGNTARLWAGDRSLWSNEDEDRWLGWLRAPEQDGGLDAAVVRTLADQIEREGIVHVAVLGMGGSSLCPNVLSHTFGADRAGQGFPQLHVFDSTVPAQIRTSLEALDLARTLFIVSSKSGSTIEPTVLLAYLYDRVAEQVGSDRAGSRFAAVTDPGSKLEALAAERGFAAVAYGIPSIAGRFSALSPFGLLPGALIGLDPDEFLAPARAMALACGADVPARENPGVMLGVTMAALAASGRDKLCLVASPSLASLGGWLEQLIAESTGKLGRGIVAIGDERLGPPEVYGDDRLFCYVRVAAESGKFSKSAKAEQAAQDRAVDALADAGHPIVRLHVATPNDLAAEFFRWELATAVAGAVLSLNPFTQPDVEGAKVAARALMQAFEKNGALPARQPIFEADGMRFFSDSEVAERANTRTASAIVAAHLQRLVPGDYFAVNAYLASHTENDGELQTLRHAVRDRRRVATSLGYGPRFLHSTGQLHKGGPNTGVFLQITARDPEDLPIPGQRYSFGVLAGAQAQGDFEVLVERGRRVLWVELDDPRRGVPELRALVENAL